MRPTTAERALRASAELAIYIDGRFLEHEEAAVVSLHDRGYLLGDAVFATLRAIGAVPFELERHLAGFAAAAEGLGIALPLPMPVLDGVVREAASRVPHEDVTLRVTVSRGTGAWGIGTAGGYESTLSVIARRTIPYPAVAYREGIATRILTTPRVPSRCLPAVYKTANYLPAIIARRELEVTGEVEGIQTTIDGRLSSGTVSNLFLVRVGDRQLVTPGPSSDCRLGVTRSVLLELAKEVSLTPIERDVMVDDLRAADEAFFANTLMECLPIRSVEGVASLGSHATCARLRGLLRARMGATCDA